MRTKKINRKMPIIGKIKIGERVQKNGKEFPISLDHFTATGKYKEFFFDVYGKIANKIEIFFMSDETDQAFNERYELRAGSKLYAWGDGENYYVWDENEEDYILKSTIINKDLIKNIEKKYNTTFNRILTLRFMISDVRVFGLWQLDTKADKTSIDNIISVIDLIRENRSIVGIPFFLSVEKVKSQKPDSKSLYPILTLTPILKNSIKESNIIRELSLTTDKIDFKDFSNIKRSIEDCIYLTQLDDIIEEIKKMSFENNELEYLRELYKKKKQELIK